MLLLKCVLREVIQLRDKPHLFGKDNTLAGLRKCLKDGHTCSVRILLVSGLR